MSEVAFCAGPPALYRYRSGPESVSSTHYCRRTCTLPRATATRPSSNPARSIEQMFKNFMSKIQSTGKKDDSLSEAISGPCTRADEEHYLLSTVILAKEDKHHEMKRLLGRLAQEAAAMRDEVGVVQCAVNQDPENPCHFIMLERFNGRNAMEKYQNTTAYQTFIREAQPALEEPLGVYICKERQGKITQAYYPFGPGGEGGRDDMVHR